MLDVHTTTQRPATPFVRGGLIGLAALMVLALGCQPGPDAVEPAPSEGPRVKTRAQPVKAAPRAETKAPPKAEPAKPGSPTPATLGQAPLVEYRPVSFERLVEKVSPGVVNIYTKTRVRGRASELDLYFRRAPRERVASSLGTGFIIDASGLVLTNHHVVGNATEIRVRLFDDREYPARVIGADPKTDIALIQIQGAESLTALPMGDSDALKVGQWVVAIGNALGLNSTVTAGIVSAQGRSEVPLGGEVTYADFIQTDASINPGNSGGPLLNMRGEVIGINTAVSREGQGIGFAIPIAMARSILPQLKRDGKVTRSWLGIYVGEVSPAVAKAAGMRERAGAVVRRIVPGGPAAKAGLREGDVIVGFDGESVRDINDLRWRSSIAGIGQRVALRVLRGAESMELGLVLARNPHE